MKIDGRSRLSRGSVERQTGHSHAMTGTPCDVPVPRNVTRAGTLISRNDDARLGLARFDEAHPELVEELIQHMPLLGGEVAACLDLEQREDRDHLVRGRQVGLTL